MAIASTNRAFDASEDHFSELLTGTRLQSVAEEEEEEKDELIFMNPSYLECGTCVGTVDWPVLPESIESHEHDTPLASELAVGDYEGHVLCDEMKGTTGVHEQEIPTQIIVNPLVDYNTEAPEKSKISDNPNPTQPDLHLLPEDIPPLDHLSFRITPESSKPSSLSELPVEIFTPPPPPSDLTIDHFSSSPLSVTPPKPSSLFNLPLEIPNPLPLSGIPCDAPLSESPPLPLPAATFWGSADTDGPIDAPLLSPMSPLEEGRMS